MKKIFTILSLTCIVSLSSNAQCAGGLSNCTPDQTTPSATFKPTPANLACAVKGSVYNESISFKIPATISVPNVGTVDIDSVEFVSFANLPCGFCYSYSKASKRYNANEVGCFTVSGTTNDAIGQYTIDIQMLAWLKGSLTPQPKVSTSLANLDFYIRVATSAASCTALNVNDPGLTAACGVGINEVAKDIHAVAIVPNPMHSSATLNFESDNAGVYTVNIVNVLGNVVSSKEVKVATGNNQVVIERNTLTEGVYFVQIANGKSTATTKFVIAD